MPLLIARQVAIMKHEKRFETVPKEPKVFGDW
jgi:hypothetical protein